ncbi:MAG: polyhydroxyalkanoic acid system family protein [Acidiferrobacterales bacterium]|nr:polyhydroxyalkanoic acid system family protein [Acidiferrobacterales bacterium]
MAKKIEICRKHKMGQDECRVVAEQMLDKLVDHFGGSVSSVGEDYQFNHPTGIKAMVEAGDKELYVNVKLGILTSGLAPKVEAEINKILDEHIE